MSRRKVDSALMGPPSPTRKQRKTTQPVIITSLPNSKGQVYSYEKLELIGRGGFASCYKVRCIETNQIYAAKVFAKSKMTPQLLDKLRSEISIHRSMHHPNIVKFIGYFKDTEHYYLLLDLCCYSGMDHMLRRRKRLTEPEVQYFLVQLIHAVQYMHSNLTIHRDLKLGNLFLHKGLQLRVGDFGLAAQLNHPNERKLSFCGTPNYLAPEVVNRGSGHSFEADIWSIGIILYTLLVGRPPFASKTVNDVYEKIKNTAFCFPDDVVVSPLAKDLIQCILRTDPLQRISLHDMISHPFFTQSAPPRSLPSSALTTVPDLDQQLRAVRRSARLAHHDVIKPAKTAPMDHVYVAAYYDYSSRYGVGYILTCSIVGVNFNDHTRMTSTGGGRAVYHSNGDRIGVEKSLDSFKSMSHDMDKKVTLFVYFKKRLEAIAAQNRENAPVWSSTDTKQVLQQMAICKWKKTEFGFVFGFADGFLQLCHGDPQNCHDSYFFNVGKPSALYAKDHKHGFKTLDQSQAPPIFVEHANAIEQWFTAR